MVSRQDIRDLAQIKLNDGRDCAISFYFEPHPPQNKSHRDEAILAKDLVRQAIQEVEKAGKNSSARADLQRILSLAERLHGNQTRAKAVFACGKRNVWREFDLPPQLSETRLFVNRRFHLKPLAALLNDTPRISISLFDRHRARFFILTADELQEEESLFSPQSYRGNSDGLAGYDGGHVQRRSDDDALHHFKAIAERLQRTEEKGSFERLVIGCHDKTWHEFEPYLHPCVRKRLLGQFSADPGSITKDEICSDAGKLLSNSLERRRGQLVREVISQAKSNSLGVTGLRRVLRAFELGEVQTLVMGENYSSRVVECSNCGHLDSHLIRYCPVCGSSTQELDDVCETLVPAAILRDVELVTVKDDPELDRVGNIAALLRFRADQSKGKLSSLAS